MMNRSTHVQHVKSQPKCSTLLIKLRMFSLLWKDRVSFSFKIETQTDAFQWDELVSMCLVAFDKVQQQNASITQMRSNADIHWDAFQRSDISRREKYFKIQNAFKCDSLFERIQMGVSTDFNRVCSLRCIQVRLINCVSTRSFSNFLKSCVQTYLKRTETRLLCVLRLHGQCLLLTSAIFR